MLSENQRYTLNKIARRNCATLDKRALKALERKGYIALYGVVATYSYCYAITVLGEQVLLANKHQQSEVREELEMAQCAIRSDDASRV